MALLACLCSSQHLFAGLTNRSLREPIAGLISGYTALRMTYDLAAPTPQRIHPADPPLTPIPAHQRGTQAGRLLHQCSRVGSATPSVVSRHQRTDIPQQAQLPALAASPGLHAAVVYPYVISAHAQAQALVGFDTKAGSGEPRTGSCEPLASQLAITPRPKAGQLVTRINPPIHACHHGLLTFTGSFPAES